VDNIVKTTMKSLKNMLLVTGMKQIQNSIEIILTKRWLTILLIFIAALSLRSVRPFMTDRIAKDAVLYVYMARDIAAGDLTKAFQQSRRMPPLYLFMMAKMHKMGLSIEAAGRIISIIAGALLIIPVYLIAELIFSSRIGAMAAFLVAVNPDLIRSSAKIMRDSLFLFLLFTALYFLMKAMKNKQWNLQFWALAGLFASLGVAVRTETVELIGVAVIGIIVELGILKWNKKPIMPIVCKWVTGLLLLISIYFVTSIPITRSIEGTPCSWTLIDTRISAYFNMLFRLTAKETLQREDTL